MKWKRKRFSKPLNIYIFFLEEDVTVTMDVIDIGYVGFHHKHEELVKNSSGALARAKPAPEEHHV